MVSGRGWIQGWTSCSEGCWASSLSYLFPWKPAVTYVSMYVQNERVCHGVSYRFWAKMWHPEDPPPTSFRNPKKHVGGGIFHVVRWNISQKFHALPPPKNSRVKGGGYYNIIIYAKSTSGVQQTFQTCHGSGMFFKQNSAPYTIPQLSSTRPNKAFMEI